MRSSPVPIYLTKDLSTLDDAIEILENVVAIRQEKLRTANSDVDAEKKRLAKLLKEARRD